MHLVISKRPPVNLTFRQPVFSSSQFSGREDKFSVMHRNAVWTRIGNSRWCRAASVCRCALSGRGYCKQLMQCGWWPSPQRTRRTSASDDRRGSCSLDVGRSGRWLSQLASQFLGAAWPWCLSSPLRFTVEWLRVLALLTVRERLCRSPGLWGRFLEQRRRAVLCTRDAEWSHRWHRMQLKKASPLCSEWGITLCLLNNPHAFIFLLQNFNFPFYNTPPNNVPNYRSPKCLIIIKSRILNVVLLKIFW